MRERCVKTPREEVGMCVQRFEPVAVSTLSGMGAPGNGGLREDQTVNASATLANGSTTTELVLAAVLAVLIWSAILVVVIRLAIRPVVDDLRDDLRRAHGLPSLAKEAGYDED